MCPHRNKITATRPYRHNDLWRPYRPALTMAELLITIAVMSIIAVSLATMATAVRTGTEYSEGYQSATRYAQVALNRIRYHCTNATASEDFPGFYVFSETVGSYSFPDTLVVWYPTGGPTNSDGPPLYHELIIYCPDPSQPNQLVEITVPDDTRTTPALSQTATWLNELSAIKTSDAATKVVLLESLRTASPGSSNANRGLLRFAHRVLPSLADVAAFRGGSGSWNSLAWVQDIHGTQSGLRQSWCRIELQMAAEDPDSGIGDGATVPFFGSAALYYELTQ